MLPSRGSGRKGTYFSRILQTFIVLMPIYSYFFAFLPFEFQKHFVSLQSENIHKTNLNKTEWKELGDGLARRTRLRLHN